MENYIDYITVENSFIDTGYIIPNNWNGVEIWVTAVWLWNKKFDLLNFPVVSVVCNRPAERAPNIWLAYGFENKNPMVFSMDHNLYWYRFNISQDNEKTYIWPWSALPDSQVLIERYKFWKWTEENPILYDLFENKNIIIGDPIDYWGTGFKLAGLTIKLDWNLVLNLKSCLDDLGNECLYDEISQNYIYPKLTTSDAMIKTIVMTGWRQELPISDGIEKDKITNRIIEVNAYEDGYAAKYDELCLSADEDNYEWIEISDYTPDKQINWYGIADFIELKPRWTLILPRNRQIAALNRPMVKWHRWDLLRIVVR